MFLSNKKGTAIKYKKESISFSTLFSKIHQFSELYEIEDKENVVIFSENRLAWIYAFYSIWNNSGVVIPIDYLSTTKEISYILKDSKPKVIFYSLERFDILKEAIANLDYQPQLILLDDYENKESTKNTKELTQHDKNKTAIIIYTSGTTGSPKGVMLSYDNIAANIEAITE
jgi:long-chain acyl-CoA synthetase